MLKKNPPLGPYSSPRGTSPRLLMFFEDTLGYSKAALPNFATVFYALRRVIESNMAR